MASDGADAGTGRRLIPLPLQREYRCLVLEGTSTPDLARQGRAPEVEPRQITVGSCCLRVLFARVGLQSASYHMLNPRYPVRSKDGPRAAASLALFEGPPGRLLLFPGRVGLSFPCYSSREWPRMTMRIAPAFPLNKASLLAGSHASGPPPSSCAARESCGCSCPCTLAAS